MKNEKENKGLAKNQKETELDKPGKGKDTGTSNSLHRDAVGDKGANNYTPQNRTDNEQNTEKE